MFTGIIEEKGRILSVKPGARSCILTIAGNRIFSDLRIGDSVAVNGVCLTATTVSSDHFTADVMRETLERSSLGRLRTGSRVNLERAMAADGRFGGHIVTGHIDGTGIISRIEKDDNAIWYTIETPPRLLRCIVEKGSIAIDGISLTVARITDHDFSVSIIPHTAAETTLSEKITGDLVNLENDLVGKYVEKLLGLAPAQRTSDSSQNSRIGSNNSSGHGGITLEWLAENGF
ncbi:MAG: riboflavin synthase [Lachnospiraceae bacterium]|nr:riboflavin synthase [Lachnospiraceae bacterium]